MLVRLPRHVDLSATPEPESLIHQLEAANEQTSEDSLIVPLSLTWLRPTPPGVGYVVFARNRETVREAESILAEQLEIIGVRLR